ncbi:MAG: hypothetical protein A2X36_04510 [Elusimicrobia bacterium GWA2_69_24]|nr:MAG: hypothetical protein A2X36_04510 [Elusimicrobia bacterium GWA2_69_24]HBL17131.1 hypothetical protein [Elusimicrobiota bacterium]
MSLDLLKPLRFLAKGLAGMDSASQLAAGFALGMAVGLIPKSSLFSHLGLILLCLVQVNLAAAYGAVALFAVLSPLFDPASHAIGSLLLIRTQALQPLWSSLYNLPIVPWTEFNNTVVLGSLLLGAALAYPVYRLSIPFFERYRETFGARLRKFKLVKLLLGAEVAGKLGVGS